MVKLVGQVHQIQAANSSGQLAWMFCLNDTTGKVVLHKPQLNVAAIAIETVEERIAREDVEDLDPPTLTPPPWKDNIYMRVIGKVLTTKGPLPEVEVTVMQPITDFNELTVHGLQCIYEHCVVVNNKKLN